MSGQRREIGRLKKATMPASSTAAASSDVATGRRMNGAERPPSGAAASRASSLGSHDPPAHARGRGAFREGLRRRRTPGAREKRSSAR